MSINITIHKPDDASTELPPPPPYSREPRTSDAGTYGNINEEQVRLLGNTPPIPKPPNNNHGFSDGPYAYHTNTQTEEPMEHTSRRRYPCWCTFIFVVILVTFVTYTFKAKSVRGGRCSGLLPWEKFPETIEFERNINITLDGRVSSGQLTIIPVESGGSIKGTIETTPDLQENISLDIDDNGSITTVLLKTPKWAHNCIRVNMDIYLPYNAREAFITFNNVDIKVEPLVMDLKKLYIKNANGDITLNNWTGESLQISNANGIVSVAEQLRGDNLISIKNKNGPIDLMDVKANGNAYLTTSNSRIQVLGSLQVDDQVHIQSANGPIQLSGRIVSNRFNVETANGNIQVLGEIVAKEKAVLRTSNGHIVANIAGEKNNNVFVASSNGWIDLHMTNEFEGKFAFTTSGSGKIHVAEDEQVHYVENNNYIKRGYRHKPDDRGYLTVMTSNGGIKAAFDIDSTSNE
ncbi:hypothetical protein CU097_004367 [Rhizopus azygosporus]|uniref:DUF4097 domain-containing protein n=1 Tax=Rhizopus azygosporus TaxID=86630 RepID=A0A367JBR0_RHIAZ|nr:hypothetical protein CU097_004367 [Rhizopus azygosporus]